MNSRDIFVHKIIYILAIGLLLIPLFLLSHPATDAVQGVQGSPGGKLAQLRTQYHLSQAQLGQVDPTSVTIKLATLGLRGVAANILWTKANDYQMKKDWTNRAATLNQITKIQPNFINVWINQAWNVSYNISVQFDGYRDRYRWVVKGFDFLKEGIKYNERQPRLLWELGRMISQKIGKADEVKQYRRLFKEDDDFNAGVPVVLRDNWLVGKEWYEKAVKMVEDTGLSMMGQSPLIYRSSAPMCQMYYADAVENDGTFGEVAKNAWASAAAEWRRYGNEDLPTSFKRDDSDEPIIIHLNDEERKRKAAQEAVAKLDAVQPGLRAKMVAERHAALPAKQRQALDTPEEKRTEEQAKLAATAQDAVRVTHDEVAHRVTGPKRKEAIRLAKEAEQLERLASYINIYRSTVNFVSWRERAEAEQTKTLIDARRLIHQGDRAYAEGDLVAARNYYRDAFKNWRKALDQFKSYTSDVVTGEDLMDTIRRYRRILGQLDEKFPQPFILQDVIQQYQGQHGGAKD